MYTHYRHDQYDVAVDCCQSDMLIVCVTSMIVLLDAVVYVCIRHVDFMFVRFV